MSVGAFEVSRIIGRIDDPANRLSVRVARAQVGCRNGSVHAARQLGWSACDRDRRNHLALPIAAERPGSAMAVCSRGMSTSRVTIGSHVAYYNAPYHMCLH
jgi:hypothetical protein